MTTSTVPMGRVTLDLKTIASGLAIVVAGVVTTVGGIYQMAHSLRSEMIGVEQRWVDRVAEVEMRVRDDLDTLNGKMDSMITGELRDFSRRLTIMESKQILPEATRRLNDLEAQVRELAKGKL